MPGKLLYDNGEVLNWGKETFFSFNFQFCSSIGLGRIEFHNSEKTFSIDVRF